VVDSRLDHRAAAMSTRPDRRERSVAADRRVPVTESSTPQRAPTRRTPRRLRSSRPEDDRQRLPPPRRPSTPARQRSSTRQTTRRNPTPRRRARSRLPSPRRRLPASLEVYCETSLVRAEKALTLQTGERPVRTFPSESPTAAGSRYRSRAGSKCTGANETQRQRSTSGRRIRLRRRHRLRMAIRTAPVIASGRARWSRGPQPPDQSMLSAPPPASHLRQSKEADRMHRQSTDR